WAGGGCVRDFGLPSRLPDNVFRSSGYHRVSSGTSGVVESNDWMAGQKNTMKEEPAENQKLGAVCFELGILSGHFVSGVSNTLRALTPWLASVRRKKARFSICHQAGGLEARS